MNEWIKIGCVLLAIIDILILWGIYWILKPYSPYTWRDYIKPKKAIVLAAKKIGKEWIMLIHCTCGNYHLVSHKGNDLEILDTAANKSEGLKIYMEKK